MNDHAYSDAERAAIYRAIGERRDMRHFAGGQVAPELLGRLLAAAHQAPVSGLCSRGALSASPSVTCAGASRPWWRRSG